jgi:nitrogen regulatory protein P-II 1
MTKLEAIIQNSKMDAVKSALQEVGVEGLTVMEVRGHGRQKGHTEVYRGREYTVDLIPKTKIEVVLPDALVEKAVQAILVAARTGKIGDGKIFLSRIDEAIRIRNDERGEGAL